MKAMNFNARKLSNGSTILENRMPLHAMLGWLGADDDPPKEEKCDFDPL
ncbi:hypothetical protein [Parapedobacter sp.]